MISHRLIDNHRLRIFCFARTVTAAWRNAVQSLVGWQIVRALGNRTEWFRAANERPREFGPRTAHRRLHDGWPIGEKNRD